MNQEHIEGIQEVCPSCWQRFLHAAGWTLFKKAPRDFKACMLILFLESLAMFNLFNVLMWILTEDAGFSDRAAGWIFGTYGFSVSLFSVLLGPLVDRLQVRKTLLLHISLGSISKLILSFTLHPVAVCVVLYGPLSVCMALGVPVVPVALRRYTRVAFHTLAFSMHYIIMNMGAALSQPIVDGFRLGLQEYAGTKYLLWKPLWSFFLMCNCLLHTMSWFIAYFFIRDVEVVPVDELDAHYTSLATDTTAETLETLTWPVRQVAYHASHTSWRDTWGRTKRVLKSSMLWRFVLLSFSLVGAKAVYVYLMSLYPLYMKRAPFPVAHPEDVPFMTFLLINPVIVIVLTWVVGALVTHFKWDRFWVIVAGASMSAGAPFFMMMPQYWAVIAFIVLLSIAEPVWSPLYNKYTLEFTKKGEEGIFFGLATIPLFVGKLLTGFMSGELLSRFCPAAGPLPAPDGCGKGWAMWLVIGCTTVASPLLLIVTQKWTWLRLDRCNNTNAPHHTLDDRIQLVDLDAEKTDDAFTPALFPGVRLADNESDTDGFVPDIVDAVPDDFL